MKRSKKFIIEYYFNENKHWAEVYDNWVVACDTMISIINKYELYKIEIVVVK